MYLKNLCIAHQFFHWILFTITVSSKYLFIGKYCICIKVVLKQRCDKTHNRLWNKVRITLHASRSPTVFIDSGVSCKFQ